MSVGCWCENAVYVEGTRIRNYFIEITNNLFYINFTFYKKKAFTFVCVLVRVTP